jgi:hypothetical protein
LYDNRSACHYDLTILTPDSARLIVSGNLRYALIMNGHVGSGPRKGPLADEAINQESLPSADTLQNLYRAALALSSLAPTCVAGAIQPARGRSARPRPYSSVAPERVICAERVPITYLNTSHS